MWAVIVYVHLNIHVGISVANICYVHRDRK
jgi:hypothetical protein